MSLVNSIEVLIEQFVVGGEGMGRLPDGRVVFVEGAIPGEKVSVRLTHDKKDFAKAKIEHILVASDKRQTPPCPYHGRCGGCGLQHIRDDAQRTFKQVMVQHEMSRAFPNHSVEILPLLFSPETYSYRHRVQLHHQAGQMGYHERFSHRICEIDRCLVATDAINQKISELRKAPPPHARFEIAETEHGIQVHESEKLEDLEFSQIHPAANRLLQTTLVQWSQQSPASHYVDLYCGNGNLSFPLLAAHPHATLTGVEANESSTRQAQKRAAPRAHFYHLPVEDFLWNREMPSPSHLVLDPPRAGLSPEARSLIQKSNLQVDRIFYVSCSLPTFLRDAKVLHSTWPLRRVQPIEFFPQTPHLELLAEFAKPL